MSNWKNISRVHHVERDGKRGGFVRVPPGHVAVVNEIVRMERIVRVGPGDRLQIRRTNPGIGAQR